MPNAAVPEPASGLRSRVVLHHELGRVVTVAWLAGAVLVIAVQRGADRPAQICWLLAVAAGIFAVGWYPALVVDDDAVTVVNPLRTTRIPWSVVDDVTVGWLLEIAVGSARYRSLAVPGPRRMGSMWERHATGGGVLERDGLTALQSASARGEGLIGLGDASVLIAQRRAARASLVPAGQVTTTWSWPGTLAFIAMLLLAAATATFS